MMTQKQTPAHPFAEIFPLMEVTSSAWKGLVESIRTEGLHHPIIRLNGKILDGRNRERACLEAGVSPTYVDLAEDQDPLARSKAENLYRRHMTDTQIGWALLQCKEILTKMQEIANANLVRASAEGGRQNSKENKQIEKVSPAQDKPSIPAPSKSVATQLTELVPELGLGTAKALVAIANARDDKRVDKSVLAAMDRKQSPLSAEAARTLVSLPKAEQRAALTAVTARAKDIGTKTELPEKLVKQYVSEHKQQARNTEAISQRAGKSSLDLRVGDWQTVLANVDKVDAVIVDPPYGADTHDSTTTRKDASSASGLTPSYTAWSAAEVNAFVSAWAPRCRGWFVALTSHDLILDWQAAYRAAGLYAFAPLPCVIAGMSVRMQGDGPSSEAIYAVVARPRTAPYSKWGTKRGAYVGTSARANTEWARADDLKEKVDAGGGRGKPIWLMGQIISDYTKPGDVVCDPMAGWGSTLIAASLLGRSAIGSDIDAEAVSVAQMRAARLGVK